MSRRIFPLSVGADRRQAQAQATETSREAYMETNLIAILITLAIAALASPVTAQSAPDPHKTDGSIARAHTAPVAAASQIRPSK